MLLMSSPRTAEKRTTPAIRWTQDQEVAFINLYKKNSLLWNKHSASYRTGRMRQKALEHISSTLGIPVDQIIRKLCSLRASFTRESRILAEGKKRRPWVHFESLAFLKDAGEDRQLGSPEGDEIEGTEDSVLLHDADRELTEYDLKSQSGSISEGVSGMKRKSFDGPGPEELFDVSNTLFENSGLKMDEMRRRATEADKFTTLGAEIGNRLRMLPEGVSADELMMVFRKTIVEAEYRFYFPTSSTK